MQAATTFGEFLAEEASDRAALMTRGGTVVRLAEGHEENSSDPRSSRAGCCLLVNGELHGVVHAHSSSPVREVDARSALA